MKARKNAGLSPLDDNPLWYKDAIIYEVPVRAFADSNGDGIGDFRGLAEKLDYLQDLGVTALWLLPFYPSPLRDDGYDIASYADVNPIYGSLTDFKAFLRDAHRRGLRVITELVVNHTSDQHPWFQRARRSPPGASDRDFYVWSDTLEKFKEARIIFSDFESSNWTWDPVAHAYFWHRFYSHQPDLNFDNPAVHEAVFGALDFWLNMGIDGLRLDAVPYLYEREGTNCENLPETHAFLKKLRRHVDERFHNRMLLAEANQWPEDAVAYFGAGDECHMAFHFPVMPRLFMAIRMEDRFPVMDILQQTPGIPDASQWALFLRNHDELTLEMVTDEDRDYMYRVYAQDSHARINLGIRRRLAPLLENHRGKIELMNGLLFSLPGTPVLYYGDEIGMGDNIYLGDRNGVRTPMQWNPERNAGFSRANPQRLYLPVIIDPEYHYQSVNVEAQQNNPHSLLWWMKRLIALRKRYQAFGRGSLEFLQPHNHKVLAFIRRYQDETILVVANLSRFVQFVELDLSASKGSVPVEMLGRTALPPIGDLPYLITLGPYAFYWLALEAKGPLTPGPSGEARAPALEVTGAWDAIFGERARDRLESVLLGYMHHRGWLTHLEGQPKSARIVETIPVGWETGAGYIALIQVEYSEGEPQTFVLLLAYASGAHADEVKAAFPQAVICPLRVKSKQPDRSDAHAGVLYDPLGEKSLDHVLLEALARNRSFRGLHGELVAWTTPAFPQLRGDATHRPSPTLLKRSQDNTFIAYGDRLVLKVFRRVEEGVHPEIEVGRMLAERTSFIPSAQVVGALDYRTGAGQQMTVAALLSFVPHEVDGWNFTVEALHRFFAQVLAQPALGPVPERPTRPFLEIAGEDLPAGARDLIGPYLEAARLMGHRTADLHAALASIVDDPAFVPEAFTVLYQRSLYQTVRARSLRVLNLLRDQERNIPEAARPEAKSLLQRETQLMAFVRSILERPISAQRTRCHGDYRLSNLLYTGKDFAIIDFEGEALRPLSSRRRKRSPIRDVASLLYSLYFAVRTSVQDDSVRPEDRLVVEPWARYWHWWASVAFVKGYLEKAASAAFLPRDRKDLQILLDFYFLRCCLFDIRYQLLNHPAKVQIPLRALLHLLDLRGGKTSAVSPDRAQ